jgi:hypothetical protein
MTVLLGNLVSGRERFRRVLLYTYVNYFDDSQPYQPSPLQRIAIKGLDSKLFITRIRF